VVSEFWSSLVGFGKPGLLPHPVETRFGHHIIQIDHCVSGQALPFEAAQARIREYLAGRLEQVTFQQYFSQLIEHAEITGIDLVDQMPQAAGPGLPIE
jgi:peptidyl-prolyl cis-trans isomerase C